MQLERRVTRPAREGLKVLYMGPRYNLFHQDGAPMVQMVLVRDFPHLQHLLSPRGIEEAATVLGVEQGALRVTLQFDALGVGEEVFSFFLDAAPDAEFMGRGHVIFETGDQISTLAREAFEGAIADLEVAARAVGLRKEKNQC